MKTHMTKQKKERKRLEKIFHKRIQIANKHKQMNGQKEVVYGQNGIVVSEKK